MDRIDSAADLWRRLCVLGQLRPRDYDADLAQRVRTEFSLAAGREVALGLGQLRIEAGALVRVLLRELQPFALMMSDLLTLYERIAATSATNDNLRIVYEFSASDPLDVMLSAFREQVRVIQSSIQSMLHLEITHDQLWTFPFESHVNGLSPDLETWAATYADGYWPDQMPAPAPTEDLVLDAAVAEAMGVLRAYLDRARSLAPDRPSLWSRVFDRLPADADVVRSSDAENWLPRRLFGLHQEVARAEGDPLQRAQTTARLRDWLDDLGWHRVEVEVMREAVETMLALPVWGKRHEFYSAWLVTEFDKALPGRLTFRVHNGVLAFPFRATAVADLDSADGPIELWAELRSPYHTPVSASRKNGIQPDYRFVAGSDSKRDSLLAIEAKQYLRPAAKNPGQALADYSGGLPNAVVILAAYGPVSGSAITHVPQGRRHRTHVYDNLRPGTPARSKFQQHVAAALPPSRPKLTSPEATIALCWNLVVPDLDLHAYIETPDGEQHVYYEQPASEYVELPEDVRDGQKPETMIVRHGSDRHHPRIHVEVRAYTPGAALSDAQPSISVTTDRGRVTVQMPMPAPATARSWHVLTIERSGTVVVHRDFAQRADGESSA